ncbi:MAG: NAD(P)-dependent glycerol-3-phosphate dehydrogenase [Proteobacteria bacterium]|nr:NAD(P)-dependent glycerol-3-phosphate dehydrogenase [Pseudomonadota bacterium]
MRNDFDEIGSLGGGAWGTALARHLCLKFGHARIWAFEPETADDINQNHINSKFLPGIALPDSLTATSDLQAFADGITLLVIVVPSHVLRGVLSQLRYYLQPGIPIICASKGIENDTLMPMSDVIESVLGMRVRDRVCYLSGPSFAIDLAHELATSVSIASYNQAICKEMQLLVSNDILRAYTSSDVLGVELGGSLKNVIAIAAGAVAGLGLGHNAAAAIVTRGLAEMTRLCVKLGGEALTLSGLSGLGDLVLTCYGDLSRNRDLGLRLGKGESFEDIQRSRITVAEGVKTAKSAFALAQKYKVDMPIVQNVYEGLYEGKSPVDVVRELMSRELKHELEWRCSGSVE